MEYMIFQLDRNDVLNRNNWNTIRKKKKVNFEFYLAKNMREKYEREKQRESINALRNDISNFRSCVIYLSSSTMSHQKRLNTFPGQREGIPEGVVRMNYDRVHANISNNEQ